MEKPSKSNGFTKLDTILLEQLISDSTLTEREYRAILLVIRLTLGTRQRFCQLRNFDFEMAHIRQNHVTIVLNSCRDKKWLYFYKDQETGKIHYSIPAERFKDDKHSEIQDPRFGKIIHKQLRKISLRKRVCSRVNATKLGTINGSI